MSLPSPLKRSGAGRPVVGGACGRVAAALRARAPARPRRRAELDGHGALSVLPAIGRVAWKTGTIGFDGDVIGHRRLAVQAD